MIKAIIFDCFGVLTTDQWRAFVDKLPHDADIDKARELNHQYDSGQLTIDEFLDQVEEATGQRPVEIEKLLDNETTKNTVLLDYIRELKNDYKIGLLSNIATDWITETFLSADEQKLFDAFVFSHDAGTTKPDPKIYNLICEKLEVSADQAIFIDDVKDYCQAAESLGMRAVHYQDFKQMKNEIQGLLDHK